MKHVGVLPLLFSLAALAQQAPPASQEVRVLVSAISDNKQLAPADLSVKCDGKPAEVKSIDPAGRIRFVLLFDVSNSGHDSFRLYRDGAIHLLSQLEREDQGAVATFDTVVNEKPSITADFQRFVPVLENARPGGGSSVFDAMMFATELLQDGPADRPKIIFLFSDGDDNQSRAIEKWVLEALHHQRISVVSFFWEIGYGRSPNNPGENRLRHFAMSGGEVVYPGTSGDGMRGALAKAREYVDGLRWITFVPQEKPGNHAALEIKAKHTKVIAPKLCEL